MTIADSDMKILPMALRQNRGFHVATKWYFDFEPLGYQYLFHQAPIPGNYSGLTIPNLSFIAGIASGKTTIGAASYAIDCMTLPGFQALTTSVTAKQAELSFEMFQGWLSDNPKLERHIKHISLRPYPTIEFQNYSMWHFRTAGKDARFIRGQEFDRILFDEAGLLLDPYAIQVLRGRLRGVRRGGVPRMARLDIISSPTDAFWMQQRFYKGMPGHDTYDAENYYSLRVSTYMNTKIARKHIQLMSAEYTDEMVRVELLGYFPDYGLSFFNKSDIRACTMQEMNDEMAIALNPQLLDESSKAKPKKEYEEIVHPRHGTTKYETPYEDGEIYIQAGDPGMDAPPDRNAPVVMVCKVENGGLKLAYFDWPDGQGRYDNFLESYKYANRKYRPVAAAIDSTGPQKGMAQIGIEDYGIDLHHINFGVSKHDSLNYLSNDMSHRRWKFPMIKGIDRQLKSYKKNEDKKLPQDIVMTMAMISFLRRNTKGYSFRESIDLRTRRPQKGIVMKRGGTVLSR